MHALILVAALFGNEPLPAGSVQSTIGKAIEFLEDEGLGWKNDRKCASCHHVPMMIWSLNEARRAGYAVNADVLSEITKYTLTDAAAKVFPEPEKPAEAKPAETKPAEAKPGEGKPAEAKPAENIATAAKPAEAKPDEAKLPEAKPAADKPAVDKPTEAKPAAQEGAAQPVPRYVGLQLSAVYTALAVESQPAWDDTARDAWNRVANHARDKQTLDGSWAGPGGRAPLLEQTEGITALAILTLIPPTAQASQVVDLTGPRAKALEWLDARPLAELPHQALAMRLLAAVRLARPQVEREPLIAELIRRQNEDGGWRQTADRPSDAFATGQSLYVLKAAGIPSDHAAIRNGVAWLVKAQTKDGNWQMVSRPVVGAPSNDKPNNTGPISYAATAWATMGLVRSVPK